MKFSRVRHVVLLVSMLTILLGGCVRVDMSESEPSLGEQLRELTTLYDQGFITKNEFVSLRQELIDSVVR